ncbi:apolipoprotein A-V isoform X1 [Mesocricetus auratus]|uniref:Apolipoprotein A-V n=2 Tax=Mesocricetus auratus TaxID=10036 RepID=A0ABM2W5K2_MESAU|nr:apolipoprotein A-V isoform X1 [Mesocricetus auratus]XP_040586146.1 apolipoprotein A-V isoform X1 [Mesocricetus auratus]XP_040586147.1 apolipoprotein A-V isoform X1 [Mesocricetus auratus]
MVSMAAVITWALALLSVLATTQARKGFWDYFSQSSGDKGMMGQQQKLAQESMKNSFEQDLYNMNNFLEKLSPSSGPGKEPPQLAQDPEGMRKQLQHELEEVRARLEPYMAAKHELVGWNLEGLRQQLKPYTVELMEQVGLSVQELQEQLRLVGEDTKAQLLGGMDEALSLLQEMQRRVKHHTDQVKKLFHPYAERLVTGIGHHVQELHRSVAPHAAASPARLSRCVQTLSHKLTLKAKDLHTSIQRNLDQLREGLSAFVGARVDGEEDGASPDPQALSEEVRQRLQAFRHDTFIQIAAFTRAIDQETEEVQQQLAPPPPGHSAFAPELGHSDSNKALNRLQSRLDDLWEDISYSLHDQGHSQMGEP